MRFQWVILLAFSACQRDEHAQRRDDEAAPAVVSPLTVKDIAENGGRSDPEPAAAPAKEGFLVSLAITGARGWVSSIPSGIGCGVACGSRFAPGTSVRLIARAEDDGSTRFVGWEGDSDCVDGVVQSAARCTARFEQVSGGLGQ